MFQKELIIRRIIFVGVDFSALVIALILSNLIRFGRLKLLEFDCLYIHVFIIAVVACVIGNVVFKLDKHIFDRNYCEECVAVVKSCICISVAVLTYLFMSQRGISYSRIQMAYFFIIYFVFSFVGHQTLKPIVAMYYKNSQSLKKIMLISSSDKVEKVLEVFAQTNNWCFEVSYITIVDKDMQGQQIQGIPIIANIDNMLEQSMNIVLDAVYINASYMKHNYVNVQKILNDFQSMGVVVHINIDAYELEKTDKMIENLGSFKVVSYTNRLRNPRHLILKRAMDIIGALVGMTITVVIGVFLVPAIKLDSKGPAIYSQIRVGKNGRHFKMYKFRSMYEDADERKKELLAQNEMRGAMFKMVDDPRITKVGKFIRKYSLDELPQFYNVLRGDMSLVGTRPPIIEEVEQYQISQKRRLSITPGMTGIWQTSGRSEIHDFDEIVKMDLQYIDHWRISLDFKLIVKTVYMCIKGKGAE